MLDRQLEQAFWNWRAIMACSYCIHYKWFGTWGGSQFCKNKKSPYYDSSAEDYKGSILTIKQELRGCEEIYYIGSKYIGQKIPPSLFKLIPKDSNLRRLPSEQIVEGFREDLDLESELTVEGLSRYIQGKLDTLSDMSKKHGTLKFVNGRFVTADSYKKE